MCSSSTYDNVLDFEWYLSVLVDLAYISNVDIGGQIRDQLVDVVGRVRAARAYAVKLMVKVLSDETFLLNAGEPGSCSEVLWAAAWICGEFCDELVAPEELLPYLLHPNVALLDSEIIAVYIQAANKIFGYWATEAAQQWTNDLLEKVKGAVETMIEQIEDFVSSPHIEVQERAANILQLFTFIKHDLSAYRPRAESGLADALGSGELSFPKSLYLIWPLVSSYELGPVAAAAQTSVPLPDGLDLDAWIVPAMQEPLLDDESQITEKRTKKSKKGKEKETPNRSRTAIDDVDSIPVVRLDDLPPLHKEEPRLFALRSDTSRSMPPHFVVEKEGEMPEGVVVSEGHRQESAPASLPRSPGFFDRISTPPPTLPSFQQYEVADEDARASTPEPIKVTRAKKKGPSSAKKKRTVINPDS